MAKSSADDDELRRACAAAIEETKQEIIMSISVAKSGKLGGNHVDKPRVLAISTKANGQRESVFLHVLKYSTADILKPAKLYELKHLSKVEVVTNDPTGCTFMLGFDNLGSQSVAPPQWTVRNVDDRNRILLCILNICKDVLDRLPKVVGIDVVEMALWAKETTPAISKQPGILQDGPIVAAVVERDTKVIFDREIAQVEGVDMEAFLGTMGNQDMSSASIDPMNWDRFLELMVKHYGEMKNSPIYNLEEKLLIPLTQKLTTSAIDGSEHAAYVLTDFLYANMHRMHEMLYAEEDGVLEHFRSSAIELPHNDAFMFKMSGKLLFRLMLDVALEKNEVWSKALDVIESYVRTELADILVLFETIPRKFEEKLVEVYVKPAVNKLPEQFVDGMTLLFEKETTTASDLYSLLYWTHEIFSDKPCSLLKAAIMSPHLDKIDDKPASMQIIAFVLSEMMNATNQIEFTWPMMIRLKAFNEKLLRSEDNEARTKGITLCLATIKCAFMHRLC